MTTENLVNTSRTLCQATTKAGQPCQGYPDSTGNCPAHRPGHASECAKGGMNSSLKHRAVKHLPEPVGSLLETLERSINAVEGGQMTPAAGSAISSLISTAVKVVEFGDYSKRLQQLEDDLQAAGILS